MPSSNNPLIHLPVELLYEIQLFAVSQSLPNTCKDILNVFKNTPPSYRAQYLLASAVGNYTLDYETITKILRYPLCTEEVLNAVFRISGSNRFRDLHFKPELPRRLFRSMTPKLHNNGSPAWSEDDFPLPFLRYLYDCPNLCPPNINSHDGYPLTKAVHAGFIPLIRFLLDHGASPKFKNNLPVKIAIHRKDLVLVRMLIERNEPHKPSGEKKRTSKRQRLEDRVGITPEMVKTAAKIQARDIVEYFTRDKGCVPDMQTLLMLS
ncbi:hypothetical protein BJ138DRAFT_521049 [Hygrophoropsis aurantiaca]|uniref:Uncharacterized protein n=1 Tax=Hygrophoropsis aurantiaca TaxID=72124 RepID=A0ACB8A210_9AGAM|nr:hypothetical protein BJ138DRAFT_521049 [Hygrophoropsis aurantiaca]